MSKIKSAPILIVLLGALLLTSACSGSSPQVAQASEPQAVPTVVVAVGSTREKPVPFGYDIILKNMTLSANQIIRSRGKDINFGGAENLVLGEGQEYLLLRITCQCVMMGQGNCFTQNTEFQLIGPDGNAVTAQLAPNDSEGMFQFIEFPNASANHGFLVFIVEQGMEYPLLTYTSFGSLPVYLALEG